MALTPQGVAAIPVSPFPAPPPRVARPPRERRTVQAQPGAALLALPDWMDAETKVALLQGYMAAVLHLRGLRGSAAAEAVFTEVFCQRHHVRERRELDRATLAEIAGVTERQVTRVLAWLRRHSFVFQGRDLSGRKLGVPMLQSVWLIHRVFHQPSPTVVTGTSMSPSHYKDLPRCTTYSSEERLYSDAARLDQSRRTNNGGDKTRWRGGWTDAARLSRDFLREHKAWRDERAGHDPPT